MNTDKHGARHGRLRPPAALVDCPTQGPSTVLPIPDTCAGGTRGEAIGCVECLGSPFHCEYLTEIDDRCFCHHPRGAEIAARTRAARRVSAGPVSEMRHCLMKILGRPSL